MDCSHVVGHEECEKDDDVDAPGKFPQRSGRPPPRATGIRPTMTHAPKNEPKECNICKRKNHLAADCFEKPKSARYKGDEYKRKQAKKRKTHANLLGEDDGDHDNEEMGGLDLGDLRCLDNFEPDTDNESASDSELCIGDTKNDENMLSDPPLHCEFANSQLASCTNTCKNHRINMFMRHDHESSGAPEGDPRTPIGRAPAVPDSWNSSTRVANISFKEPFEARLKSTTTTPTMSTMSSQKIDFQMHENNLLNAFELRLRALALQHEPNLEDITQEARTFAGMSTPNKFTAKKAKKKSSTLLNFEELDVAEDVFRVELSPPKSTPGICSNAPTSHMNVKHATVQATFPMSDEATQTNPNFEHDEDEDDETWDQVKYIDGVPCSPLSPVSMTDTKRLPSC